MARPKIAADKRRTVRVETLLTPAEAEALRKARSETPVSEFVRDALRPLIRPWFPKQPGRPHDAR